jgi:hypothetical protein
LPVHAYAKLDELEAKCSTDRYVDLAVRYRLLDDDGKSSKVLYRNGKQVIVGGRWDRRGGSTRNGAWVRNPSGLHVVDHTVQKQQLEIVLQTPPDVIQVGILSGRQAGKTHVGLTEIIKDAIRWPGRSSAIISRDYKASREPEQTFRSMLDPSWGVRECKTDRCYTFPHLHTVVFRSREAIDSVRGPSLKTILLDEFALYQPQDYMAAVGCGAASDCFRLIFATTPRREAVWFRELIEQWKQRERSRVYVLKTFDNPRRNQKVIEEIEATTPADLYSQEFKGELVRPRLAVYYLFDPSQHVRVAPDIGDVTEEVTQEHFGRKCKFVAGWDFGREAVVIAKVFRDVHNHRLRGKNYTITTDYLHIVGEVVEENITTEHVAQMVIDKYGTSIGIITDAMGAYDRCSGRGTEDDAAGITLLREAGFAAVEPVGPRNPAVNFRVKHVLRMLHSVRTWPWAPDGERRLFVDPKKCRRVKDALENHQRDKHTGKPQKDGYHEHPADALGYLVYSLFPIEDRDDREKENDDDGAAPLMITEEV